jgi:hypothetical protein
MESNYRKDDRRMFKGEPSFYERESVRIQAKLEKTEIGTDEYNKLTDELMKLQTFAGKEKERKQFFTKEGKGNIIGKVIGFLGLGGITLAAIKFEKDGHMFSGSSASSVKSAFNIGSKLFL